MPEAYRYHSIYFLNFQGVMEGKSILDGWPGKGLGMARPETPAPCPAYGIPDPALPLSLPGQPSKMDFP